MKGYLDGRFRPDGTMTRAEFAAVMGKAFPSAPKVREAMNFSDVASDFWGKAAIAYAYERGFLTGYPDSVFQPNQAISRAQAMVVMAKTQGLLPVINTAAALDGFVDANQVPNYAESDIAASTQQGLVVAYPDKDQLRPNDSITRGEAAALLCRVGKNTTDARYYVPNQYIAGTGTSPQLSQIPVRSERFSVSNGSDAVLGDRLFFWGSQNDGQDNIAVLWETDGTAAGTQPVSALTRVRQGQTIQAQLEDTGSINAVGNRLWLQSRPRPLEGRSGYDLLATLWSSDGTDAGTSAIAALNLELPKILETADTWLSAGEAQALTPAGKLPFAISGPNEAQLWQTNGEASGTERLATFSYVKSDNGWPVRFMPQNFTQLDSYMLFTADSRDGASGLWRTNGTPEETTLFKTFEEITIVPMSFTSAQDYAYFTVGTPELGNELWVTGGTRESTAVLKDVYPGTRGSSAQILTHLGETYFFLANSDQGMELWATEGVPTSTRLVKRLSPDVVYDGNVSYAVHDGKLFFAAPTLETSDEPDGFLRVEHAFDLWVSDGTPSGTQRLGLAINNSSTDFMSYQGRLFFNGYGVNNGEELWVSDGSAKGTYQVTDLAPGGDSYQENCPPQTPSPTWDQIMSSQIGQIEQTAEAEGLATELPQPRCVFRPSPYSSDPRSLTVLGDYLYFIANDDELFRTDGTAKGLQKIGADGDEYSLVRAEMTKLGNQLLLTGYNEESERSQMWTFSE